MPYFSNVNPNGNNPSLPHARATLAAKRQMNLAGTTKKSVDGEISVTRLSPEPAPGSRADNELKKLQAKIKWLNDEKRLHAQARDSKGAEIFQIQINQATTEYRMRGGV